MRLDRSAEKHTKATGHPTLTGTDPEVPQREVGQPVQGSAMSMLPEPVCGAEGTHDDTATFCDMRVGHTGPHVDTYEGWEWDAS